MSLDDPDWSAGIWEAPYRTRLVRQRERTDCGVACLAMAAGISYDEALETFLAIGLEAKKPRLSSNFSEMTAALCRHGLAPRMARWRGWAHFTGLGILKTRAAHRANRGSWHWMVAESHPSCGYLVRDPASPLAALERAPMAVSHMSLDRTAISGCWVQLA